MLFMLQNVSNGNVFYLIDKNQFLVGRKDCDLLIQNDQSISRKHAVIRVQGNKVTVEDCGSKYKTSYRGESLEPNTETELPIGENIQFGVCNSLYSLQKYEFVTTGTLLNSNIKKQLIDDLSTLNGKYMDQWSPECTHLTVEEITLTIKFLYALIDKKPIVKPTYWTKFVERVKKNLPPPNIELFNKPPVAEALLNKIDFKLGEERRTLFKGKLFIFPREKDKKKMEDIIKKTGGASISWEKDPLPFQDMKSSPKEFLIVQTTDMIDDPSLNEVIEEFSNRGKRTIPLQEIPMSIVLCSCEKNCNPNFDRIEQVFKVSGPGEPSESNALVENTQSQYFSLRQYKSEPKGGLSVIPDTFDCRLEESDPFKMSASSSKVVAEKKRCSGSAKRSNNDPLQGTPFKKSKVNSENVMDKTKKEKEDNVPSKGVSSKRKIDEESGSDKRNESERDSKGNAFDFLNRNKRSKSQLSSSAKDHPFKVIKREKDNVREVNKENPFAAGDKNKKRGNKDDTSDVSAAKKIKSDGDKSVFSSTRSDNTLRDISGLSGISRIKIDVANNTWMSKNTTDVVEETNENLESYFDVEMKKFVEQFRNTVVVEIMDEMPTKPKLLREHVDGDGVSNGRVNFKIFRKVMPLKPQTTTIGRDNFIPVGVGDTSEIPDTKKDFHNSDDESEAGLKTKKKTAKKFLI